MTGGAIALVYGISRAAAVGWADIAVIGPLMAAAALLALFILVERAHLTPLIPLAIFTRPQLVRANLCILMFGAYVSFQFVLTLYYQDELNWSPLQAGLAFLLGAMLTGATARYAAVAVTRSSALLLGSPRNCGSGHQEYSAGSSTARGPGIRMATPRLPMP